MKKVISGNKYRLKRFVKIGGEMISLVMVEEALAGLLSDNIECCAVELPDAKRGSRIVGVTNRAIDEKDSAARGLPTWRCQKNTLSSRNSPIWKRQPISALRLRWCGRWKAHQDQAFC